MDNQRSSPARKEHISQVSLFPFLVFFLPPCCSSG
jgi:hypothetical protein